MEIGGPYPTPKKRTGNSEIRTPGSVYASGRFEQGERAVTRIIRRASAISTLRRFLYDFIGAAEQRNRQGDAERLRGLHVDS